MGGRDAVGGGAHSQLRSCAEPPPCRVPAARAAAPTAEGRPRLASGTTMVSRQGVGGRGVSRGTVSAGWQHAPTRGRDRQDLHAPLGGWPGLDAADRLDGGHAAARRASRPGSPAGERSRIERRSLGLVDQPARAAPPPRGGHAGRPCAPRGSRRLRSRLDPAPPPSSSRAPRRPWPLSAAPAARLALPGPCRPRAPPSGSRGSERRADLPSTGSSRRKGRSDAG